VTASSTDIIANGSDSYKYKQQQQQQQQQDRSPGLEECIFSSDVNKRLVRFFSC